MTLDSRLRRNDGNRSRCARGTGLDSRLRGNDAIAAFFRKLSVFMNLRFTLE